MLNNFPESDWKSLSRLKPLALERLCQRILQEAGEILDRAKEGGGHSAYLELYKHIDFNDKTVADCFNDWRRSRAVETLIKWKAEGLLTDEEYSTFSAETRGLVEFLLKRH